jgi:hypothetical protein
MELRSLIIVDGTLHVEGGLSKSVRTSKTGKGPRIVTTEERDVSTDRRAGNVVAANYMRRIRDLKILRTHWGALVDPENLDKIKGLIAQATRDTLAFNKLHKKCRLENTMIWEPLRGARLDAVVAWIERRIRAGDQEVKDALALLVDSQGAVA